jgi:hypothetical protein
VGLTTLPCKKKIIEKLSRNSAGFCGGGHGLSWAVEPRKEEECHHGMERPQVADGGSPPFTEGSCEYIE